MKRRLIGGAAVLFLGVVVYDSLSPDRYSWPISAQKRIEGMAEIIHRIEGPARWCYPSRNALNLNRDGRFRDQTAACLSEITPASDFEEIDPNAYIRRFYRGSAGDMFCEVTLSTVRNNDRIVGSDCYYGLFYNDDDTGLGMTDDPFG